MKYLVATIIAYTYGVEAIVSADVHDNPTYIAIMAVIAVAAFFAACCWRVLRSEDNPHPGER